jgi:hypothetical protein
MFWAWPEFWTKNSNIWSKKQVEIDQKSSEVGPGWYLCRGLVGSESEKAKNVSKRDFPAFPKPTFFGPVIDVTSKLTKCLNLGQCLAFFSRRTSR